LSELNSVGDTVTLEILKEAGVVNKNIKIAKIVKSGEITTAVTVKGVGATKGAKEAIEAAGGKVEE
jgi:large subunit ribosomal protein L15